MATIENQLAKWNGSYKESYLIHVPVIFYLIYPTKESIGLEEYIDSAWLFINPILALTLSLALSLVTYLLVELPFLNMKRRIPDAKNNIP